MRALKQIAMCLVLILMVWAYRPIYLQWAVVTQKEMGCVIATIFQVVGMASGIQVLPLRMIVGILSYIFLGLWHLCPIRTMKSVIFQFGFRALFIPNHCALPTLMRPLSGRDF